MVFDSSGLAVSQVIDVAVINSLWPLFVYSRMLGDELIGSTNNKASVIIVDPRQIVLIVRT